VNHPTIGISQKSIKDLVYVRRAFNDLEDLQQAITEVFDEIRHVPTSN
jgi:hypothetical protein